MARKTRKQRDERTRGAGQPDQSRLGGPPTTGGSAPGGAPTGLGHRTDFTGTGGGAGGVESGGVPPTAPVGGTGTSAGGLATGPGGIGGTRNLPRGAGRAAASTRGAIGKDLPPESTETDATAEESDATSQREPAGMRRDPETI